MNSNNTAGINAYATSPPPPGSKGLKDPIVGISLANAFPVGDTLSAGGDISHLFKWRESFDMSEESKSMETLANRLNSYAPFKSMDGEIYLILAFQPQNPNEFKLSMTFTFESGKEVTGESDSFFVN